MTQIKILTWAARLKVVVMPGACTIKRKKNLEVLRKKRAHPANDFIFLNSWGWKLHFRQAYQAKSPHTWKTTLELHFTVSLFRTFQGPLGFLGAACILGVLCPRHLKCRKAQSWWERLACGHFRHLLWDIISGSSSSNTGVTWEKRFMGSKHSPSDNLEPHSLTWTSSSLARISPHSTESGRFQTGKGPWGHFVSWESVLIKVTQVVTKPQVDCRSPDWWASAFPYSTNCNNY